MEYPVFSFRTRAELLKQLCASNGTGAQSADGMRNVFDAIIIGGGIVGAGLARELAIRGVKTLLVEKSDFSSGTSSRSSKLIHGGLRYLEMFDFHLVFEALAERHWLLKTHPHLVTPLEFNLPIYAKGSRPPGARNTGLVGMGLWVYDALSLFRTPFFHGRHSAAEVQSLFPKIRGQGLKGSYYYADAMMLDDELVLETVLDARRRGAVPLNYVKALDVSEKGADGLYSVSCLDTLDKNGASFVAKAGEVIVCVGPWTEAFGSKHVARASERKLRPSKGVHLIVPWSKFPIERCLVMSHSDGRIIFAIPRKDLGRGAEHVIIGTTDSPERGDLDNVHASKADVDYLLRVMGEYFPEASLKHSDIVMTYAGVRPLLDSGAESEATTSREHEIWRNEAGIVFMAGGKYTTFRKISQEIADFAFPRIRASKFEAKSKELLSEPFDYQKRFEGRKLWGRYTDEWVRWKLEHHAPCTLEDLAFRRLPIWMAGHAVVEEALDLLIEIARPHFDWSEEDVARERAATLAALDRNMQWRAQG